MGFRKDFDEGVLGHGGERDTGLGLSLFCEYLLLSTDTLTLSFVSMPSFDAHIPLPLPPPIQCQSRILPIVIFTIHTLSGSVSLSYGYA
jgi:hypothetical protein